MSQSGLLDFADLESKEQLDLFVQQKIKSDEGDPVRGVTFLSDEEPEVVFERHELRSYEVDLDQREEFIKLHINRRLEHSKYEDGFKIFEATAFIIPHDQDGIYTAFLISNDETYEKCLISYIKKVPSVSTSYLTTEELRGVLDVLDDQISGDIIVEDAVIKSPRSKTDILYLKEPYYNLFNTKKVDQGDYFVDKINFTLEGRSSFSGFISRVGETRYSRGSSDIYFDYLLDIAGEAILNKGSIFEGKSREYGTREAERIEIDFEEGAISGKESNHELIDALRNMNSSSLTVYHKNPYLHASVLDFEDGSSADVFITSSEKISIIPGFEASKGSLSRICERINSHFNEGDVHEAEEGDPEFDKFFSG